MDNGRFKQMVVTVRQMITEQNITQKKIMVLLLLQFFNTRISSLVEEHVIEQTAFQISIILVNLIREGRKITFALPQYFLLKQHVL